MSFRTVLTRVLGLFFGLIYPSYGSITAIESVSSGDDTQWLVYWLIFSLLQITESLLWPALKWLPLYQELKIALLAWLVLPQTKGAMFVYESVLHPGWELIKKELSKNPALEQQLSKMGGGRIGSGSTIPGKSVSKAEVDQVIKGVTEHLEGQLSRINSTVDPDSRTRAEKDLSRTLAKMRKLA